MKYLSDICGIQLAMITLPRLETKLKWDEAGGS